MFKLITNLFCFVFVVVVDAASKEVCVNFWPKNVCLEKCWVKKVKAPKKLGQKNLIKIGSVAAEILLPRSLCCGAA